MGMVMKKLADINTFEGLMNSKFTSNNVAKSFGGVIFSQVTNSPIPNSSLGSVFQRNFLYGGDLCTLRVVQNPNATFSLVFSGGDVAPTYYSDDVYIDADTAKEALHYEMRKLLQTDKISSRNGGPVFNSVVEMDQLGEFVVNGFAQVDAGELPPPLYEDLSLLTDSLVEGMGIVYDNLRHSKETPEIQAQCEKFMDMHRRFCDKIPSYAEKAKEYVFEE